MLREQITEAMKDAMRARDAETVSTVRMILAGIKDKDIAARPGGNASGIGEPEILSLLQSMVKQRRESVVLYTQGNRADLVAKEEGEITVIE
ncbi:MAG TPA: GatB/YqeY domain-containing protein, partial [Alphaproteobacteria bacterium]|nr:GatB/YqeY domain-containing protein [Alphaproteobacteria bacterium]